MKKIYVVLLCMMAGLMACEKDIDFGKTKLVVETNKVTPDYTSAIIECAIATDATVNEVYLQYTTDSMFFDYQEADMTEYIRKCYRAEIVDLQENTVYYYRYLVRNALSSAMSGGVEAFQTLGRQQSSSDETIESSETFTVNGVSFTMVGVEGGTFTMGATSEQGSDAFSDEKPTHSVTLSDYAIGETEVTQELWKAVMGSNPSNYVSGTDLPVVHVNWIASQAFIQKLNQLTGKNFRLPTEAEWEYAARGGQKSKGYKYAGSNTLSDVAWYIDNSSSKTPPVKQKQANELGLYDMSGNVGEWCQDWYGAYSSSAQTNPTGPTSGSSRVWRGGFWRSNAWGCRVSDRLYSAPADNNQATGLRLAL